MKQGVYLKNQEQFERSLREVILEHLHSIVDSLVSDADSYLTLQFNCSMEEFYLVQYQDLRQMQVNISVAEADIGQLHIDQLINFTVDAFQQRKFAGRVKQIRLNPTIQENVVTYNVVAMVDNADGALLPGMTANINFIVMQKHDVLRVSNAALRYQPKDVESGESAKTARVPNQATLYLLSQERPEPIHVLTGITDGNYTEITSGEIKPGEKVIISEVADKKESDSKFKLRVF